MGLGLRSRTCLPLALAAAVWTGGAAADRSPASVPAQPDDRTIVHVLNRLGYGAAPGDIERVRQAGLSAYIDRQLHPDRIPDAAMARRLARFETLSASTAELARKYFIPALMMRRARQREGAPPDTPREPSQAMRAERSVLAELTQQKILRAAYSERQLQEVLVDFWFNHFNVFAGKGPTRMYLTEYERDAIRPHVLGRFRDLLGATAHSPAMLFYLDNWQSASDARGAGRNRRPRGLNENYARELMELHTLGVDGGYTQKDVQEVARAFTGWTIDRPRQGGGFRFEPRMHDAGEKVVLGHRLAAGGGKTDGERVLDLLAAHPSTARFIAAKLARKFVADDPPAALVDRAAARFRETGGDIREVVRTIVTSPEMFAPAARRAKVKTPFEFVVSAVRASGVELTNAMPAAQSLRELGMPLYGCQPPTGYADRAAAWVNTGALLGRMNFAVALADGTLRGVRPGRSVVSTDPMRASDAIVRSALAGDLSASTRATIAKASAAPQAVALVLGSPEFQKR